MTQKSIQEANKKAPLNTTDLDLAYLKCPLKGHNNLELKFISKREFPHLTHIYCPICLIETARDINARRPEIACLDEVFKEGINLSHKYVEALEPLIANLQAKQKKITENNLKQMCKSVDARRRNFKKALQAFKMEISTLCKSLEDLFVKQLEVALDQNLAVLDSRFTSFKDSLEVLRYRLNSYEVELPKVLLATEDRNQYCKNINTLIKDFQTLQSTSLLEIVSQTVEDNFSSSHVAQKISTDRSLENGFADTLAKAIKVLSEKVETVKKSLEIPKTSLEESHNGKLLDTVMGQNEVKNENKNSGDTNKGDHIDGNKKENAGSKQGTEKSQKKKKGGKLWPDPADEGIHVFDKELAILNQEVFMRRLAESLESIASVIKNEKNKKKMSEDGKKVEEKSKKQHQQQQQQSKKSEKENKTDQEIPKQEAVKEVEKSAPEVTQKPIENKEQTKNVTKTTFDGEEVKAQEKGEGSTDKDDEMSDENNYVSDDDEEEVSEPQRYKDLITGLKATLQPEILRKVFRAKKLRGKGEKPFRKEFIKFSTVLEEREEGSRSTRSSESKDSHDVSTSKKDLEDNKSHQSDSISQKQKDFTKNFLSQLKVRLPNPEAMTKLQKLIKKVKLHTAYKNKRLSPETIMAVQDFMGEVLRESHVKNVLEYRANRRQLSDSEEILKYDYVCRDFFIAYYLYYKNIKSMFLDALGVPKENFNNDYKHWVEHGHTYLAWSRFKAKVQKAPLTESKRIIQVEDLKRILSQLLYFIKDPLEEFKEDIAQTQKADRYLLIELLMARVFDKAFFAFHIEEEDILCSLKANTGPSGEEAHKMYEQFESIIAGLMYPDVKIQVNTNIVKKKT